MVQAIFFDIDGTLVSFKTKSIPAAVKEAIHRIRQKGIKIVISTGRSPFDIKYVEDIEFDGFITANGAFCIDSKGEIIAQQPVSKESLERLGVFIRKKPFPCSFMTNKGNYVNYIDDMMLSLSQLVNIPLPPVKPIAEILEHAIFQIDAFIELNLETELLNHVLTDCIACRWHPYFADFNSANCSKATGMDRFMTYFGMEHGQTMAFGDGGNDISMLKNATIGIAMGNAKDNVKAVADYVTSSVDEDGIINALKHFNVIGIEELT